MIFSKKIILLLLVILLIIWVFIIKIKTETFYTSDIEKKLHKVDPKTEIIRYKAENKFCRKKKSKTCLQSLLNFVKNKLIEDIEQKIQLDKFFDSEVAVKDSANVVGLIKIAKDLKTKYEAYKKVRDSPTENNYFKKLNENNLKKLEKDIKDSLVDLDENNLRFIFELSKLITEGKYDDSFNDFKIRYKYVINLISDSKKFIKNIHTIDNIDPNIFITDVSTVSPKQTQSFQEQNNETENPNNIQDPYDPEYLKSIKTNNKNFVFVDLRILLNEIGTIENNKIVLIDPNFFDIILTTDNFAKNKKIGSKLIKALQKTIYDYTKKLGDFYKKNKKINF
jgi:hypothetical protein